MFAAPLLAKIRRRMKPIINGMCFLKFSFSVCVPSHNGEMNQSAASNVQITETQSPNQSSLVIF